MKRIFLTLLALLVCATTEAATTNARILAGWVGGHAPWLAVDAMAFGADPTGILDSTNAINLALSTQVKGTYASVYLPPGTYKITNTLTTHIGQCLYGDSMAQTRLTVGSTFNSGAAAVISVAGSADPLIAQWGNLYIGACMHDMTIIGAQPTGMQTTTTAPTASGTTITVSAAPAVGYYANDETGTPFAKIPSGTTVVSVTGTGPYTVTLSATATGVLTSDVIDFNPTRAGYKTLAAGCTTTTTSGSGCKYPPFIITNNNGGSIWNLTLAGAWDGINSGAGYLWMDSIRMGALDLGWSADGAADVIYVDDFSDHPVYGFPSAGNFSAINIAYGDGGTIGWQLGRIDTLKAQGVFMLEASLVITANANSSQAPWTIDHLFLDTQNSNLSISGGLDIRLTNFSKTGSSTTGVCPITIVGGTTTITNPYIAATQANFLCISAGELNVEGGFVTSQSTFYSQNGGNLSVQGQRWLGAGTMPAPFVVQSGGAIQLIDNYVYQGGSGGMISVASDNAGNFVAGNQTGSYTQTFPAGTLGYYATPTSASNPQTFLAGITANAVSTGNAAQLNNTSTTGFAATHFTNDAAHTAGCGIAGSAASFAPSTAYCSTFDSNAFLIGANSSLNLAVNPDKTIQLKQSFTVGTLPTCNAAEKGALSYVTDAAAPTYNATLTGGGAIVVPVFCNGSAWTAH